MARYVPIALLRSGRLELDDLVSIDPVEGRQIHQWVSHGHIYDSFPPVAPLLALPVYAVPVWLGRPADANLVANLASKIAASIMAALSAALLYAALRRILPVGDSAWVSALVYGLGTSTWSTASQGLWTHSPAVLTLCGALLLLTLRRPGWAATVAAVGAVARPVTLVLIPLLASYDFSFSGAATSRPAWERPIAWLRLVVPRCLGAAAVVVAGALYNLWLFGSLAGTNEMRNAQFTRLFATHNFDGSLPEGLLGLTLCPNRGLLVFSPVVVFAFWGGVRAWSRSTAARFPEAARLARSASLGFLVVLLVYSKYLVW